MDKETQLYDAFIDCLIHKLTSKTAETKDLNLIKEFINERKLGANPQTHKGTAKLVALPFDNDEEAPLQKIK